MNLNPFKTKATTVRLTPLGTDKLASMSGNDTIRYEIMQYLHERGGSTPQEIAQGVNINPATARQLCNVLAGRDYKFVEWY